MSGKNLTTIYATNGHGDHFFGTSTISKNIKLYKWLTMLGRRSLKKARVFHEPLAFDVDKLTVVRARDLTTHYAMFEKTLS
jgi:hypothetical protein